MKIMITGAEGFIAQNLITELENRKMGILYKVTRRTADAELKRYCKDCDFVFHLAGVNRPKEEREFMVGNYGCTARLLETLEVCQNLCPVVLASSIQAELQNPYGRSKKAGEDLLFSYGQRTGTKVYVYRFPNVFGKWCRPNYNSVVATFCHNIARGLPIQINDRSARMTLVYIDDLVEELLRTLERKNDKKEALYLKVPVEYEATVGGVADLLFSFYESRNTLEIPDMTEGSFSKKLYSTYLSYLPADSFSYPLKMNVDDRGSFTEILKTRDRGQVSVNITKPGLTKGNHWHHTKNEKFVVVSGEAVIKLRRIGSREVSEYRVSGEKIEVVDIPVGYTHNITNIGDRDLVAFMWCNELFNPEKPDTFFLKVESESQE